jgi:hypothetical protein
MTTIEDGNHLDATPHHLHNKPVTTHHSQEYEEKKQQ